MFLKKWLSQDSNSTNLNSEFSSLAVADGHIPDDYSESSELDSAFEEGISTYVDFIGTLPNELGTKILCYVGLDIRLFLVSKSWYKLANDQLLWKDRFINRFGYPIKQPTMPYNELLRNRVLLDKNWRNGNVDATYLEGHKDSVYCLQFDSTKIISGSRDRTIRIWDMKTLKCIKSLSGHSGSVLCLRYDSEYIYSGSSDCTIKIWDLKSFELAKTLPGHRY
jgi:WD40 repeat protein